MKRFVQITFIVIVFIALLIPILKFNKTGTISETENRNLAAKPDFNISNLNFSAYDSYFQDRFGGREKLINIANFMDYNVFFKSIKNSQAFKGKNGWYYYIDSNDGNNKSDFYKVNLLTPDELEEFKKTVKATTTWCNENGIKYLFIIGPNKHSVYPEYYISPRPAGITRADQLVSVFNELGIPLIYPRDYLIEQKTYEEYPLYYETDTHWNKLGAYHAFEKLQLEIERLFPEIDFPRINYDFTVSYSETEGDILPMLGIKTAKSTQIEVTPKNGKFDDYFEYVKNEARDGIITKGKNSELPTAIVFRDSYFMALVPFFSTMFSYVEYNWRSITEEDKDNVLKQKPDLIVFENVERYSLGIAGNLIAEIVD